MSDKPLDLLAFGAHPDDVELSCGGLLALAAQRAQRVVIADLTRGERATNGSISVRALEAIAAAAALGVERTQLGLPDGGLNPDEPTQVAAVVALVRRLRPRLVLAPWHRARHPDHAAASTLVERAAFFAGVAGFAPELGVPHRPDRVLLYPERVDGSPSFVVDTSAVQAQKQAALDCHRSQLGDGGRPTLINRPLGRAAFEVRDRYWGASIGVAFGEPYLMAGPVPMADPIAHFAAHPAVPVLWPER